MNATSHGQPLEGLNLKVTLPTAKTVNVKTNKQGVATVKVMDEGNYTIAATPTGYVPVTRTVNYSKGFTGGSLLKILAVLAGLAVVAALVIAAASAAKKKPLRKKKDKTSFGGQKKGSRLGGL